MKHFLLNKTLWQLTTVITLFVAIVGVVSPGIYTKVMHPSLIPATMAQDILTILVTMGLLVLVRTTKAIDTKKQIIIIGILGSFGYLYAIFAIERVYNILYLCYLGILGLTLYTIPLSLASLRHDQVWHLPKPIRIISIIFSVAIAILFSTLWISSLIPAMTTGNKIELYYSIYILDLVWIMPGFLITAVLSILKKSTGLLLSPAMNILGIFVIFPLGLGELAKPFYGLSVNSKDMTMSFLLAGAFLTLAVIQLFTLRKSR